MRYFRVCLIRIIGPRREQENIEVKNMDQTKLIKSLKLEKWFLEESGRPDSVANRFIFNFVLGFILNGLTEEKKKEFLKLVAEGENEAIFAFVQENIPGFENKMVKELEKKIKKIKVKALNAN